MLSERAGKVYVQYRRVRQHYELAREQYEKLTGSTGSKVYTYIT